MLVKVAWRAMGLLLAMGCADSISCLAFSSDGQMLACGSVKGVIQVWETYANTLRCTIHGPKDGIEWVRWHPRECLVLAGSEDSTVCMWNVDKSSYTQKFLGHEGCVSCGDFTPDGETVCTGSHDASLWIWERRTGEEVYVVRGPLYHTQGLTCLTITADSLLVLTASRDGCLFVVNITTGQVVTSFTYHSQSITSIGLSESGCSAATGSLDNKLIIWDLDHLLFQCTCRHKEAELCLSWIGATHYVATGCADGKVRIWDSNTGDCLKTLEGHTDSIQALAISRYELYLVSVSSDKSARVFGLDGIY